MSKQTMIPRIKKLWIDALKSDAYDQNFKENDDENGVPLRTEDDTWSAFGVLCNVYAMEHLEEVAGFQKTEFFDYEFLIPRPVAIWAGLLRFGGKVDSSLSIRRTTFDGRVFYDSIESMVNDRVPFYMIADAIDINF